MASKQEVAKFYKRKQVESATPGQLVVLLYDGAIDHLNRAEQALQGTGHERFELFHNSLIHCQNIVTELTVSLDFEKGGEIANNLFRLYDYINYRLVDANIRKEAEPIQEARELLGNLRMSWLEVVKGEQPTENEPKQRSTLNLKG